MTASVTDSVSTSQTELEKLVSDLRGLLANKDLDTIPEIKLLRQRIDDGMSTVRDSAVRAAQEAARQAKEAAHAQARARGARSVRTTNEERNDRIRALNAALGYRPVSGLAVAALIVGCVSALALVSPVFWVVPLVGAALALVAVRDVTRSGVAKAGGLAAVAGLALSLGFGAQAVTAAIPSSSRRWTRASISILLDGGICLSPSKAAM